VKRSSSIFFSFSLALPPNLLIIRGRPLECSGENVVSLNAPLHFAPPFPQVSSPLHFSQGSFPLQFSLACLLLFNVGGTYFVARAVSRSLIIVTFPCRFPCSRLKVPIQSKVEAFGYFTLSFHPQPLPPRPSFRISVISGTVYFSLLNVGRAVPFLRFWVLVLPLPRRRECFYAEKFAAFIASGPRLLPPIFFPKCYAPEGAFHLSISFRPV